jgi:hypothetical protein
MGKANYPTTYMKIFLTLITLALTTFGCVNKQVPKDEKSRVAARKEETDKTFKHVADFPTIKDSAKFIANLKYFAGIKMEESPSLQGTEKISVYKKIRMYGSNNEYFFIEYDYGSGCGAAYPWKYQLLLTTDGKHVGTLAAKRFEFIKIFNNEAPFLLTLTATSKGNGGHELYKISENILENVLESDADFLVRTYDSHEDDAVYEPNELTLTVKDCNNDGFNDISFKGKVVFIEGQTKEGYWVDHPFKKNPVAFIFLYNKQTGHFRLKGNYGSNSILGD